MEANGHQFGRFARSLAAACVRCAVTANEAPRVPLRWPFATTGCKSDRMHRQGRQVTPRLGLHARWITALFASLALGVAGSSSTWSSECPEPAYAGNGRSRQRLRADRRRAPTLWI